MRDDRAMRTTLDIADDLLQAAKEIAACGEDRRAVSELLRKALQAARGERTVRNGVLIHRRPGAPVMTMALVNELRTR
jgi:Arc/MetJ family transcription regulator